MRLVIAILVLTACCSDLNAQDRARVTPFTNRTNNPIRIGIYDPMPASATSFGEGLWRASYNFEYASVFWSESHGTPALYFADGELARMNFCLSYGLLDDLDVGIEYSIFSWTGGVLDRPLTDYHDFWGLPNAKRDEFPFDKLRIELRDSGGDVVWRGDTRGLKGSDLGLWGRYRFLSAGLPAGVNADFAARGVIKLPTGASTVSSGNLDLSAGLLGTFRAGAAQADFNFDAIIPGGYDLKNTDEYDVKTFFKGTMALQYGVTNSLFALAQVVVTTPAFDGGQADLDNIGSTSVFGTFGAKIVFGDLQYQAAFAEDLNTNGEADFSIIFGVAYKW
ncbi:MAG: DUF3187 family protein [Planctomycetes bacterium]|nr:DUF3187 family protein [Planctomycetota bacterium]NUQ34454.1 DUF3187 family protein [Planctomycetaceae bacterium]